MIHSIRVDDQSTQVLQISLVNYIIATWFRLTLPGEPEWFSHVGVAHTNSVNKVFQSLLLTGNSFRLLVYGTNLIACCCQRLLARQATAIARSAGFFLVARPTSASPSPSLLLPCRRARAVATATAVAAAASDLAFASAGELSRRARLPVPSRRRQLAITAIAATQASSPSAARCRQADSP